MSLPLHNYINNIEFIIPEIDSETLLSLLFSTYTQVISILSPIKSYSLDFMNSDVYVLCSKCKEEISL